LRGGQNGAASAGTGDSEVSPPGEAEFSNVGVDTHFTSFYEDDDSEHIEWHKFTDWAIRDNDLLANVAYENPAEQLDSWCKGSPLPHNLTNTTGNAASVNRESLNAKQLKFMNVMDRLLHPADFISSTDDGPGELSRCVILRGRGGSGKSHCMRCLQSELSPDKVRALTTTGKAATVLFRGSTVHSRTNGLAIPVGKEKYTALNNGRIRDMQDKWRDVKVVFIDEMTMLKPQDLQKINLCLKLEIKACDKVFGGVIIVLVGDTAQLPPVGGSSLWASEKIGMHDSEIAALRLYKTFFTTVVELNENKRRDLMFS